jgi:hypothetical protein
VLSLPPRWSTPAGRPDRRPTACHDCRPTASLPEPRRRTHSARPHRLRPHRLRPHRLRRRTALRVRNVLPPFGTRLVKGSQRAGRRRYPNGYGLGRRARRPHRPLPSRAMGHPTAPHKRTRRRTSARAQAHDAAHNVCTHTRTPAHPHDAAHNVCTRTGTPAQVHPPTPHTTFCTPTTPAARARRGGSPGAPSDHAA